MDNSRKVAFSWIELILVILFVLVGMGFWALADFGVDYYRLAGNEPTGLVYERAAGIPAQEARATLLAAEQAAVQEALVAQEGKLRDGAVARQVLESRYPALASPEPVTTTVPATAFEQYTSLALQQAIAATAIPVLETRQAEVVAQKTATGLELAAAQQEAAHRLATAQAHFRWRRQLLVLGLAGAATVFFIVLAGLPATMLRVVGVWQVSRGEVLAGTTALLLLVFGYAAFNAAGAACGALLVLAGLSAWLVYLGRRSGQEVDNE